MLNNSNNYLASKDLTNTVEQHSLPSEAISRSTTDNSQAFIRPEGSLSRSQETEQVPGLIPINQFTFTSANPISLSPNLMLSAQSPDIPIGLFASGFPQLNDVTKRLHISILYASHKSRCRMLIQCQTRNVCSYLTVKL